MAELNARIKPKKSSTTGEVPQATDLEVSEIAVNTADGKLFVKHTDNSIKEISGAGGAEFIGELNDVSTLGNEYTFVGGYSGDTWPPATQARVGYTSLAFIVFNGADWPPFSGVQVGDVLTITATNGQADTLTVDSIPVSGDPNRRSFYGASGSTFDASFLTAITASTAIRVSGVNVAGDPSDGQVLTWVSANSQWEPVDAASGGAVDSVNGETGVVSLGIQDMDDFKLSDSPNAATWSGTWTIHTLTDNQCAPAGKIGPGLDNGNGANVCVLDEDGVNQDTNLQALANGSLYFSVNGGPWTVASTGNTTQACSPATKLMACGDLYNIIKAASIGDTIDIADGVVDTGAPLVEGDILKWNDTEKKFKPAQPAVESVNGETGAVVLGIQDMDDYKAPGSATWSSRSNVVLVNGADQWNYYNSEVRVNKLSDANNVASTAWLGTYLGQSITATAAINGGTSFQFTATVTESTEGSPSWWLTVTAGGSNFSGISDGDSLALSEPGIQDGDILQWNETQQKFIPAQPSSGTGGSVDSVNSQTGAVSLGIQDMDDFGLNAANAYRFDGYAGNGSGPGVYGVTSNSFKFNEIDSDGNNCSAVFAAVATPFTVYYKYSADDVPRSATCNTMSGPDSNGEILLIVDAVGGVAGSSLTVSLADLSGGGIPLIDGDILQWDTTLNKFKPAQAKDRIQDMDDFDLKVLTSDQVFTNKVGNDTLINDTQNWTIIGANFLYNQDRSSVMAQLEIGDFVAINAPGISEYSGTVTTTDSQYSSGVRYISFGNGATSNWGNLPDGTTVTVSSVGFDGGTDIDLAEGDILKWSDLDQKFKPENIAGYVSKVDLKAITAASTSFADFQARIAAL